MFIIDSCNPNQDTVHLINGTNPTEGRLEVCGVNGLWGTVCDDNFDLIDGQVVCQQLGFIGMFMMFMTLYRSSQIIMPLWYLHCLS